MSRSNKRVSVYGAVLIATVIAVAIGVMTLLGFVPVSQADTLPPECSAAFGNVVACGGQGSVTGLAIAAALISGAISYLVVGKSSRR